MSSEIVERSDLSVYVVGGVPRSFKRKLQKFVEKEAKGDGDVMLLDDEFTEWIVARLRNDKRRSTDRTPASSALWRAFAALSAARYHLQHNPDEEQRVRDLRNAVEEVWRDLSPMFEEELEEEEQAETAS
jgi:hypothetical protein